jgi:dihydropteroate synthase
MKKYKLRSITDSSVKSELIASGFSQVYVDEALAKYHFNLIKIHDIKAPAANILKQTALSKGADAGVSSSVINCKCELSDCILAGTDKQLMLVIDTLKKQPYGLADLANELHTFLRDKYNKVKPLQIRNKVFEWGTKTHLMGILNITPDSFSDGGKNYKLSDALLSAQQMIENNTDIIDIGGESTRPGANPVDTDTQINRIIPLIKELRTQYPQTILSVDTRDHRVAEKAIETGADIINDISGLRFDSNMVSFVATNNLPVIIMHSKDTPEKMQQNPVYDNLMDEITDYLLKSAEKAINKGLDPEKIIIDPGIGFGKTVDHNLEIIQRISELKSTGYPVMAGVSRKAFTGKILNEEDTDKREEASAAVHAYLISQKIDIIRVHNVIFHSKVIKMTDQIVRRSF